ncbi:Six-hairpin glycosidase-like protein [Lineolata rhizophorae]|uniref:Six-hairpin glycosidase-like protein n=1 Tax=Lineolata rhizophorae TaxID=578093 RepID=A0A6A6NTA1_9PEZI|nr:Six-hairpin glycosidase-like protein [Lineolata rhizophorae]
MATTLVNRLSASRSPYVRAHMHNPVAWQMWTPEALALARQTNRLLFVSIGYAACHWCHVMERESFSNQEVASILNSSFIPIKVDREERPDIDRIYMNYVQATTGSGGWPLNVFLTPDLEPIFGGTYWPGPNSTTGTGSTGAGAGGGSGGAGAAGAGPGPSHIGLVDILCKIRDVWATQRQRCLESAKEITAQLRDFAREGTISRGESEDAPAEGLDLELLEEARVHFERKYDAVHAGFGRQPKFPTPVNLSFLLRLGQYPQPVRDVVGQQDCDGARAMAVETLRAMARGGIRDHIGHGFARYSVTRDWSLPHFEKMLYDQAQLLSAYLDAYLITKDPEMLDAVTDICTYLTTPPIASLTAGFFSAEDADSLYRPTDKEKREGAFYVWTLKEFQSILGERDAEVCARYYNVLENGNVSPEYDAHDEMMDQNVLAVSKEPEALAKEFGLTKEEVIKIINGGKEKLRAHREKERPRPSLDDKIVVSWNGLAIGALARTGAALESVDKTQADACLQAAVRAVTFIRKELFDAGAKTICRVYREGPGDVPALADDYAFLIAGLLDLYEATFEDAYLEFADILQRTQIKLFWDGEHGGFFATAENQPDLILRLKDGMDGAEPSTNGVSAANLDRLASLLEDEEYAAKARRTAEAFEIEIIQHPFLFASMMASVVAGRVGMRGVVICGPDDDKGLKEAVQAVGKRLRTNTTVARVGGGKGGWLRGRSGVVGAMDQDKAGLMACRGGGAGAACEELGGVEALEGFLR